MKYADQQDIQRILIYFTVIFLNSSACTQSGNRLLSELVHYLLKAAELVKSFWCFGLVPKPCGCRNPFHGCYSNKTCGNCRASFYEQVYNLFHNGLPPKSYFQNYTIIFLLCPKLCKNITINDKFNFHLKISLDNFS